MHQPTGTHMYHYIRNAAGMAFARQLAEVLRRIRTEADLTHRQMARRLGVSHATSTRLENANQNVTLRTLTQLCRALDFDMGALFGGEIQMRRSTLRYPGSTQAVRS